MSPARAGGRQFPLGRPEIIPEIKRTSHKPIRYVFNTHFHGHYSYGNSLHAHQGAAVLSSAATAEEMRSGRIEYHCLCPAGLTGTQNTNFAANCRIRGSPALRILPKVAELFELTGKLKFV